MNNKIKVFIIFSAWAFFAEYILAMEQQPAQMVPSLVDFCQARLVIAKQSGLQISTNILPQELRVDFSKKLELVGNNATEAIENSIIHKESDSFLTALCLYNKNNETAQQLLMQLQNRYPDNLYEKFKALYLESPRFKDDDSDKCLYEFDLLANHYKAVDPEATINDPRFVGKVISLQNLASRIIPFLACYDYEPAIRYLVNNFKANINHVGSSDIHKLTCCVTGLHAAIPDTIETYSYPEGSRSYTRNNTLILIKSFIDLGASIDASNPRGGPDLSPLELSATRACHKNHKIRMLLNYGSQEADRAFEYLLFSNYPPLYDKLARDIIHTRIRLLLMYIKKPINRLDILKHIFSGTEDKISAILNSEPFINRKKEYGNQVLKLTIQLCYDWRLDSFYLKDCLEKIRALLNAGASAASLPRDIVINSKLNYSEQLHNIIESHRTLETILENKWKSKKRELLGLRLALAPFNANSLKTRRLIVTRFQ